MKSKRKKMDKENARRVTIDDARMRVTRGVMRKCDKRKANTEVGYRGKWASDMFGREI